MDNQVNKFTPLDYAASVVAYIALIVKLLFMVILNPISLVQPVAAYKYTFISIGLMLTGFLLGYFKYLSVFGDVLLFIGVGVWVLLIALFVIKLTKKSPEE